MAADFATFKDKYPELTTPLEGNRPFIEECIIDAELILGTPPCTKLADSLLLAWAAHCVFKSGNYPDGEINEGYGVATSKSVGSVSVSYQVAQTQGDDSLKAWYVTTPYGQKFLMYQKYCYGAGVMVAP